MRHLTIRLTTAAALFFSALSAASELGAPFRDHAILQRGMAVPVWGWSKPGKEVSVEFAGQKQTATADPDGKWTVVLKDLQASSEPAAMVIHRPFFPNNPQR